jgi:signal transduction histidine kinase
MRLILSSTAICLTLACAHAAAGEPGPQDAIAMAERGAALMKAEGKAEMMKRVSARDPQFAQGVLHIDVCDARTGMVLAHPYNPGIVGQDPSELPDSDGKTYRREIIQLAAAKGKGWVEHQYRDPGTGKLASKSTYFVRVDDVVLEAGIYKQ